MEEPRNLNKEELSDSEISSQAPCSKRRKIDHQAFKEGEEKAEIASLESQLNNSSSRISNLSQRFVRKLRNKQWKTIHYFKKKVYHSNDFKWLPLTIQQFIKDKLVPASKPDVLKNCNGDIEQYSFNISGICPFQSHTELESLIVPLISFNYRFSDSSAFYTCNHKSCEKKEHVVDLINVATPWTLQAPIPLRPPTHSISSGNDILSCTETPCGLVQAIELEEDEDIIAESQPKDVFFSNIDDFPASIHGSKIEYDRSLLEMNQQQHNNPLLNSIEPSQHGEPETVLIINEENKHDEDEDKKEMLDNNEEEKSAMII